MFELFQFLFYTFITGRHLNSEMDGSHFLDIVLVLLATDGCWRVQLTDDRCLSSTSLYHFHFIHAQVPERK